MSYSPTQNKTLRHIARHKTPPERTRSTTIEALARRGAIRESESGWQVTETGKRHLQSISENLTPRTNRMQSWFNWRPVTKTFDDGQADYLYWDKARRGQAEGLQIAGLLLKPIASKKAAWTLGDLPQVTIENDIAIEGQKLSERVNAWLSRHHATIMLAKEESATLGDIYLSVNADLSVATIAPNLVEVIANEDDYSEFLGWRVWQQYDHPTDWGKYQTIMDEFTMRWRRRSVWRNSNTAKVTTYRMPLPDLPVVHIPNNLRANERFGHSEGEALVYALHDYNAMFDAAADGVIRMGRPMIALEHLGSADNIARIQAMYGDTVSQTLPDGTPETTTTMTLSSDDVLLLGETGTAKLLSPGSFTGDTGRMLELIFYLFVQHTELPEFVLGTAIASSKASAEAQMPAFTKWIEKEQRRDELWLRHLIRVYVATLTYTTLGRVVDVEDDIRLKWLPLTNQDGTLTLQAIDKAQKLGVPNKYLVPHLPLDLDDQLANIQKDMQAMADEAERFANGTDELFVTSPPSPLSKGEGEQNPVPTDETTNIQDYADSLLEVVQQQPGYVYVDFANDPELMRVQQLLMDALPSDVDAEDTEHLHITMVYAMNIGDKQFGQAVVDPFDPFKVRIIGVGMFNNPESRALHLVVEHNAALDALQRSVYDAMTPYVPKSPYSNPENWQPHITMAYLPKGVVMPSIAFEPFEIEVNRIVYARDDYEAAFVVGAWQKAITS